MSGTAALRLALRRGASPVTIGLRGPEGTMVQALADLVPARAVAVIGPPGPAGGGVRIDVTAASASWVLGHSFGRVPAVSVYLPSGEQVITDVVATSTTVSVIFASARTGFIILN